VKSVKYVFSGPCVTSPAKPGPVRTSSWHARETEKKEAMRDANSPLKKTKKGAEKDENVRRKIAIQKLSKNYKKNGGLGWIRTTEG
jgi:hypothetical protein